MNYTVYMHIAPNGKRYIGITSRKPEYRWSGGNGYKPNKHFYNAILKYGWDNIEHCIMGENLSKEDACALEQELIARYDTTNQQKGFNRSIGGESGSLGVKKSQEAREKLSASRKGKPTWAKGKRFSQEHCEKISQALTGKHLSKETKQKRSIAHKGKTPWIKGKTMSDETRKKTSTPIICIETNISYFGLMEAERQTGISHSNISNCLKGKREIAGGYHWSYYNEE